MIDELDDTLRELLKRSLPIENEEVDIAFEQPRRAWSSRLTRPTLNLFLHDVRENVLMRQMSQPEIKRNGNGTVTERRNPLRVDLTYLITAWASDAMDEHRMLGRTLLALARYLTIPSDLLSEGLKAEGVPVNLQVGRDDASGLSKPMELWSALDNEARPSLSCLITAPLNPFQVFDSPMVQVARFTYFDKDKTEPHVYSDERDADKRVTRYQNVEVRKVAPANRTDIGPNPTQRYVRGQIRRADLGTMSKVTVRLEERDSAVPLDDEGYFTLFDLAPGTYHLIVKVGLQPEQRHEFEVPTKGVAAHEQVVITVT